MLGRWRLARGGSWKAFLSMDEAGRASTFLLGHWPFPSEIMERCLLDEKFEMFGRDTIFVAGDRVQTDAIAVPFSMGRDLLCIYSKKHTENPPELKGEKSKHNRLVMKTMAKLFKEGGKCIWVAPSGGRDRKDSSGEYEVANFDAKSVEMFRLMSEKAGRKSHFYPLSMVTADV